MTDFPITANDARIQYTATASQTVFPYDFPIFDQSHLAVTRVRAGVTTTLVITTDYTVSGVGVQAGGNVTLTSGATTGDLITISRDVPAARATDYNEAGDFFATALNQDLDLLVMQDQQIIRDLDRSLRLAAEDILTTLNAIPSVSTRAGQFFTFDSSGQPSVAAGASDAPVSSAMAPVVAAISVSAGRDAFGLEIGSDVQAYDAGLSSIASITVTADRLLYAIAADQFAATTITQFGRTLIDDADADAARTTIGISNHNAITVDSTGRMTNATQPAFLVTKSASQTNITAGTAITVAWQTEIVDRGGNFGSNLFTAPITGLYQLAVLLQLTDIDTAASQLTIRLVTSNRSYVTGYDPARFSADLSLWTTPINILADMDVGDTAHVTVTQTGGSNQLDINDTSFFSGVLIA